MPGHFDKDLTIDFLGTKHLEDDGWRISADDASKLKVCKKCGSKQVWNSSKQFGIRRAVCVDCGTEHVNNRT